MNNVFWISFKYLLTAYLAVLIPIYYRNYGIQNFLWLSDIGLFLTALGLWINSGLLVSMAAVGVLFLESVWNIDFFCYLFFNVNLIGLSEYMFDNSYSKSLRGLSLFHIFMPIIWVLYLAQYGYDNRAILYFVFLYWTVLFLVYFFTKPKENINWVFFPELHSSIRLMRLVSGLRWVAILFIFVPLLIFLPTHYILAKLFS